MWTAIGVAILVVAQAGTLPAGGGAKGAPAAIGPKRMTPELPADQSQAPTISVPGPEAPAAEAPATPASTETTLRFRNDVGDAFQMSQARFALDGRDLPTVLTSAARGQEYVIFAGPLAPGSHTITSHVTYQGQSRSIFTYMKGYTFNLDTTDELNVPESGATTATIVGKPNKGFNVPFEHSLKVGIEQPTAVGGTH